MINSMNRLRTHKDSARFGFTEYSDMSDGEFVTTKLNGDLNLQNFIIKEKAHHHSRPIPYHIIRYTRDIVSDVDSLPKRIDW